MTIRRRFTADFKAKVALEALRGDKTIQEISARHKVHPSQGLARRFGQAQQLQQNVINRILAA